MNLAKNKNKNLCAVKWCRNERAEGRKICNTCKHHIWLSKGENRLLIVWHWIKKSALKRNIKFDLDKKEFIEFLKKHSYIEYSGQKMNNFSIDRIKPELGYTINNLQVITKLENINKYHNEEKTPF